MATIVPASHAGPTSEKPPRSALFPSSAHAGQTLAGLRARPGLRDVPEPDTRPNGCAHGLPTGQVMPAALLPIRQASARACRLSVDVSRGDIHPVCAEGDPARQATKTGRYRGTTHDPRSFGQAYTTRCACTRRVVTATSRQPHLHMAGPWCMAALPSHEHPEQRRHACRGSGRPISGQGCEPVSRDRTAPPRASTPKDTHARISP